MNPLLDELGKQKSVSESEEPTRVAIYVRTSSPDQKLGYSKEEQIRQCVNRCEVLEWETHFVFCDEALSGKDIDRPMFQQMLSFAERGAFDVLMFWKLDRVSRSIMHAVQLENQFRELDVALHSITEQIDTTTPAGRFNFRNIANAAEFERELIKQRTKMGHIARAMEHKWPNSSPPIGYDLKQDGTLTVDPSSAALVRRIFRLYIQLRSMPEVADELNDEGRFSRSGSDWTASSIGTILRNPIYVGQYAVGEIDEQVPEYQILKQATFDEVTKIRNRFLSDQRAEREQMPKGRKRKRIDRIIDLYSNFVDNTG